MKKRIILIMSILSLVLLSFAPFVPVKWSMDPYHSQLHFSATHFGISQVEGAFQKFTVDFQSDKSDFSDATFLMTADVKSINTQVEYRDNDLKSGAWFDADKYPTLVFKSTSFTKVKGNQYKLKGDITIHGITKPVVFDAVYNGMAVTMSKKNTAGFTIKGKIKRTDFGVGEAPAVSGVGDDIIVWANTEIAKD